MAIWLLNDVQLVINTGTHKVIYFITEIEFYVYDEENHKDTCVHRSTTQMSAYGQWYFHREFDSL